MEIKVLSSSEQKRLLKSADSSKIKFLSFDILADRTYIVAIVNTVIVGVVSVADKSARINNALGVGFVSVHTDHQRKGIAKKLVANLFAHARAMKKHIANTQYETEGLLWLKPAMMQAALDNPDVLLYER